MTTPSDLLVSDNMIISLDYKLTVDGDKIDSSEESGPIEFIQGHGQIIAGLERELYGMAAGESKQVQIAPADGYGEENPEAFADIPRGEFPPHIPLEPGVELQLRTQAGETMEGFIVSTGDESVLVNFNHPLAGKELHFDVRVVKMRHATPEELDHGHVHDHDHEHH